MKKMRPNPPAAEPRRRAEERLRTASTAVPPTAEETSRLLHELEVRQIELGMQNEELVTARAELEVGAKKYADLYDFAPVGYFTLDPDGVILQANLTGTTLLGVDREQLLERRFGLFLHEQTRPAFTAFLERVFTSQVNEHCEAEFLRPVNIHIEGRLSPDGRECRVVVADITARKASEAAMSESEEQQRELARKVATERARLVEAQAVAQVGSWETDLTTLAVEWSAQTHRIFETDPAVFHPTHQGFLAIIHPEDRARVDAAFGASMSHELPCVIEHRIVMPDGRLKFVQERWRTYHNDEGKPLRAVGTCWDITERKLAEAALRRSEAHLANAQRIAHIGSWALDLRTQRLSWSDEIFRIFGLEPHEFEATFNAFFTRVHPEDQALMLRSQEAALAGQAPLDVVHRIVRADGEVRWVHELGGLIRDNDGQPIRLEGTVHDITSRREAEKQLIEREKFAHAILDSLDANIAVLDRDGRIQQVNRAWLEFGRANRMTGLESRQADEDYLRALDEVCGEFSAGAQQAAAGIRAVMVGERAEFRMEYPCDSPEERRWFLMLVTPLNDGSGGVVVAHLNITARKLAEEHLAASHAQLRALLTQLQQAQEDERKRIAREIHDELGQLLTGLKMDMHWIEQKLSAPGLPPSLNPLVDRAVAATELADALIAAVQKLATELRPSTLDQLGLAAALTANARRFEARSGIHCVVTTAEAGGPVPPEVATELFYICQEALTNVARHAHATQVHIQLESNDDEIRFELRDDGVGIAAADLEAPRALGLLGMKERAAHCHGTIEFQRCEPSGTQVTVRMPRAGATTQKGGGP